MSHTNTTANYNLPQFTGTDKPSWLTDVNGAMTSIDTQMKANADANTTTAGDLSTLAGRVTTAEENITSQGSTLQTVSNVASSASTTATNAKNAVDGLTKYLTLNNTNKASVTANGATVSNNTVRTASNNNGTMGKIYGQIDLNVTNASGATIKIQTPFRPTEGFKLQGNLLLNNLNDHIIDLAGYQIASNGEITVTLSNYFYNKNVRLYFIACMMQWVNFGD